MKLPKLENVVKEILEQSIESRNDNFKLVLNVYRKLNIPIETSFTNLMLNHKNYNLPSIESITRARRKVVSKHPELQAEEKIKEFRKEQEQAYFEYAIGGEI